MNYPKRILLFSLAYYPKFVGGAEVAIKEITDRIDVADIEFHMITNRFDSALPRVEKVGNVLVHRVGFAKKNVTTSDTHTSFFYIQKVLFVVQAFFKARSLHAQYKYDGFWAMMFYMSLPVMLLRLSGRRLPYVLTLQEGDSFEHVFKRWYIKPFKALLHAGIKNASVVQPISTFLASWATQIGYSGPVEIVPNGVDTEHFSIHRQSEQVQQKRKELELQFAKTNEEIYLITTSRLVHKNGVDVVLRALSQLPRHYHFIILGEGPDKGLLTALTDELRLSQRVHFLGHVDRMLMPAYLHVSDIFIRPSRSEGLGISFIEAMAAEKPVVATTVGGITDFLFDTRLHPDKQTTGWAVGDESPRDIATVVKEIIEHPEQTRRVTDNALKLVTKKYDWETVARDMREKVFSRI